VYPSRFKLRKPHYRAGVDRNGETNTWGGNSARKIEGVN
jgi:hypothetical protein